MSVLAGVFQCRYLCVEVGERAMKLLPIAPFVACFYVGLYPHARENKNFSAATSVALRRRQRVSAIGIYSQLGSLGLI